MKAVRLQSRSVPTGAKALAYPRAESALRVLLKPVRKHPHKQVLLRPEAWRSTELLDPERTQSLYPESGEGVRVAPQHLLSLWRIGFSGPIDAPVAEEINCECDGPCD